VSPAPRIIGYLRVSTEEQAESGLGLEAQERKIRAAAELHGWELVDVIADEGVTGTTLKRPGLRRAMRAIAKRQADGLVAAKLDRVSRSSVDMALVFEWFRDADAQLVLLDVPGLDTSTPIGKAMSTLMAMFAELERDLIAQRTREALASLRKRGKPTGRPAVADNAHLQRRIQRMRAKGLTLQAIADELNAEGVPTLRGGREWRPSSVQNAAGYARPAKRRRRTPLPALR
jgi:DNA invertase Pin-like site-specific DNA recombinase